MDIQLLDVWLFVEALCDTFSCAFLVILAGGLFYLVYRLGCRNRRLDVDCDAVLAVLQDHWEEFVMVAGGEKQAMETAIRLQRASRS